MSGSLTSPTAAYIDATGIHAPDFNSILSYLVGQLQTIYGSDIYLGNDSQDGQLIGIVASAVSDNNDLAVAVYNSFSPTTAQGVGLSSVVKINGITRQVPTNSVTDVVIIGIAGTIIPAGIIADAANIQWSIPPLVTIPFSGTVTVQATCLTKGAVLAQPNTLTNIRTSIYGWQEVTNPQAATLGQPVETDAALRQRQTTSTMLPAQSINDALIGAVASVAGVTRQRFYENNTSAVDANGQPAHSICFVVAGGDPLAIATAIASKKTPGCATFGTTQETVVDTSNVGHSYYFFRPTQVNITAQISITPLLGYNTNIGNAIVAAVINFTNTLPIGDDCYLSRVIGVANLSGPDANTFNLNSVKLARSGGNPTMQDIAILFNEAAYADTTTVTLNV